MVNTKRKTIQELIFIYSELISIFNFFCLIFVAEP